MTSFVAEILFFCLSCSSCYTTVGRLKKCIFLKSYAPWVKSCSFWSKKPQKKISWNLKYIRGCLEALQICRFWPKMVIFVDFWWCKNQSRTIISVQILFSTTNMLYMQLIKCKSYSNLKCLLHLPIIQKS